MLGEAINAPKSRESHGAGGLSMLRGTKRAAAPAGYQCSKEQRQPRRGQATNAPKSRESHGAARLSMLRRAKRAMVLGVGYQCSEEQREPWCSGRASINAPRSKESPGGVTSDDSQVKSIMGRVDLGGRGVRIDRDDQRSSTCTNQRNRGRTSAARSTRATRMLTVPRSLIKSSTKDLT